MQVIPIHKTGAKNEFNTIDLFRSFHNFLKFLGGYLMIDFKDLSVKIVFYQTVNLIYELVDLLAWQLV